MHPAAPLNRILFADTMGNALRCSQVQTYQGEVEVSGLALKFVTRGCENYRVNGRDFAVNGGRFLVANHLRSTQVEVNGKDEALGICVDFSADWVVQMAALAGMEAEAERLLNRSWETSLFEAASFGLQNWLQNAHTAYFSSKADGKLDHARTMWDLGSQLIPDLLQWQRHFSATGGSCLATREARLKVIWQAKRLLDQQPQHAWKLESLAKEAGMSKFHLLRQFKQVFGLPPHQYLLQKRLHWAKSQLSGSQALSELALEAGFADLAAFSKAFKKQFGESPSNLRQLSNF